MASSEVAVANQNPLREGLYLRVGLGLAYGRTQVRTDRVSQPDVDLAGAGPALDAWLGWALARGLFVGPALSYFGQSDSRAELGERERVEGSSRTVLIAAFIDAYPSTRRREHFGGLIGFGKLTQSVQERPDVAAYGGGGLGFAAFAGYDFPLAHDWALGGLLKLGGTVGEESRKLDQQTVKRQGTTYSISCLATLAYY